MNQITIVGNVGSYPEITTSANGVKIAKYSIAVSKKKNIKGETVKSTTWFRIIQFKNGADFAEKYVQKGMKMLVIGELEIDEYTDKDGAKRTAIQVIADKTSIMSSSDLDQQKPRPDDNVQPEQRSIPEPMFSGPMSDDLPF